MFKSLIGAVGAVFCALALHASAATPFLAGGDVSVLPLMEQHGARYFDRQGEAGDALKILRDSGHNVVRLRLYEAPGPGNGNEGYHWPAGSMDLPDLLAMAKRSAALGMQIDLTFHYSDFWTNAKTQNVPAQWRAQLDKLPDENARFERLRQLVFERITGADNGVRGSFFIGLPERPIEDVLLRDVDIPMDAARAPAIKPADIPQARADYPDPHMFAPVMPAWGLWTRDVRGLVLARVRFASPGGDARPMLLGDPAPCVASS